MKKRHKLRHNIVDYIPDVLEDGVLYVSVKYATAVHLCCCGCGSRVVTPISPRDWLLIFDGQTVSLEPSVGNWNYACRSHYIIERNRVIWLRDDIDTVDCLKRWFGYEEKDTRKGGESHGRLQENIRSGCP